MSDRAELVDFINRYTSSIGYSHDTEEWMKQVAGFIANAIEAQAVWVYQMEPDMSASLVAFSGRCPTVQSDTPRAAKRLLETLVQERINVEAEIGLVNEIMGPRSMLKDDMEEQYGKCQIKTLMAVPMFISSEQLGFICAINRTGKTEKFSTDDLFLLESMSSQVALGITFVQLYNQLGEKQRIEQELRLAQNIQKSLLPEDPPEQEGFRIHADCVAAREVSGDFFDFIKVSDNLLLSIIADASGKGMPACMLTAMCRSILRTNAERFKEDIEGLMKEINEKLFADTSASQFVTLACLLIDSNDYTIEYARAGHTSLLLRYPDGHVEIISPEGPALGLLPAQLEPSFDTFSFSLLPGMSLMLYTDGITEALNADGEEFGIERLLNNWQNHSTNPMAVTNKILRSVSEFTQGEAQYDDQTLMLLHRPEETE